MTAPTEFIQEASSLGWGAQLSGHYWTLSAFAARSLRPSLPTAARAWQLAVPDARLGRVLLTGWLSDVPNAATLLVIVHGLGGSADSAYTYTATRLANELGISTLRLHLRGADRRGEDFFHAGLGSDLAQALAAPDMQRYTRVALLGFSLGGHVCLSYGVETHDPRVRAICAICPPLGLRETAARFDLAAAALYRRHVLDGLKQMYSAFQQRHAALDLPSVTESQGIARIQDWDQQIVAPRHGFDSAADYYARASVGPRLRHLICPTLLLSAKHDPMVPRETSQPYVSALPPNVTYLELPRGGHLAFPHDLNVGLGPHLGLDGQAMGWIARQLIAG